MVRLRVTPRKFTIFLLASIVILRPNYFVLSDEWLFYFILWLFYLMRTKTTKAKTSNKAKTSKKSNESGTSYVIAGAQQDPYSGPLNISYRKTHAGLFLGGLTSGRTLLSKNS